MTVFIGDAAFGPTPPGIGAPHALPVVRAFGPSGTKAVERIDDERQRLEIDDDLFDRFGGGELVNRGDGEDRLARVERLVGQRAFGVRAEIRQVVGGEDRLHAGHRERGARVDAAHARVRHRAEEELGEQHAVGAEVFGVARPAGDLRDEVRRRVVLADEFRRQPLRCPPHVFSAAHAAR